MTFPAGSMWRRLTPVSTGSHASHRNTHPLRRPRTRHNRRTDGALCWTCETDVEEQLHGFLTSAPGMTLLGPFLFATASQPALQPTQPPIQWAPGALSLGIKRPGRDVDHSPPPSDEAKNAWSYTSTPSIRFHGVVLI
jgi:hypothetical protein